MPDEPLKVWGDPDAVTQVCYNLLDNAAKFAAKGPPSRSRSPKRTARPTPPSAIWGPPSPRRAALLFDRFHKADYSRSMDREGVGLGLYIVKTILGNLKENITVTSEDGVTNFTFTLTPCLSSSMLLCDVFFGPAARTPFVRPRMFVPPAAYSLTGRACGRPFAPMSPCSEQESSH